MVLKFIIPLFFVVLQVNCQDPFKAGLNSKVVLPCNITVSEGEFVFSLLWKHDDNDVAIHGGNMTIYHGNYKGRATINPATYDLTLENLAFSDSGLYVCTLTTSRGSSSRTSSVVVLATPTVKAFSIDTTDDGSNDPLTLAECSAIGASKEFKMSWVTELGDMVIPDSFKVENANSNNSNLFDAVLPLTIQPDSQRNNGRKFTCVVVDALGNTITSDTYLKVTVPTTTPQSTTMQAFPQILIFPAKMKTMNVGESEMFECLATGVPTPDLSWVNQNQEVISSGAGSSILKIESVNYNDAGTYTCKVGNTEGNTEQAFELSVQGPPLITYDNVGSLSESIFISEGWETVSLACEASGNPEPKFIWTVENVNDTDLEIEEKTSKIGDKVISSVNISAKHFDGQDKKVNCFASNELGVSEKEYLLIFPVAETANAGMIVGVVIAIMVLLVVVFLIIFFALTRRSKSSEITSPTEVEKGCTICPTGCFTATPCDGNDTDKAIVQNEDGDQIKEVKEDGTSEEKQKLTEAEEQPAEQDKPESETSEEGEEKNEEKGENEEEKVKSEKKNKLKIRFSSQCCRGNKEDLKDEADEKNEKEEIIENGEVNSEENKEKKEEKESGDKDSGKGDTLEKVAESV